MLTTLLAVCGLMAFAVYRLFRCPSEIRHIPAVPLFKSIYSMFLPMTADERRIYLYADLLEKHGVVRQWLNSRWVLVLGTPEAAEKLYMQPDNFPKNLPTRDAAQGESLLSKFLGENLVHSNDDQWRKYRRIVNKAFKKQFEPEIFISVVDELRQVIDEQNGKEVDMSAYLRRLTMEVLGIGLMDVKINAILSKDALFNHHYFNIIKNLITPITSIFKFLDHPKNPMMAKAYESLNYIDSFFDNILEERREKLKTMTEEPKDILSLLLQAMDGTKDFTDKELRDNIMIFVLAGHDTTAFALAVGLYFLCKNPEIQEKARQEALAVFGKPGADKRVPITHEQLKQIPFIEAIIKEAMRYYPSVSRLPSRINQVEFEVNGITIPKNQMLTLEMIHFSRSAKYWENPDEFDPYRFYNTTNKDMKHSFAWSTFGGGQRLCIGKDFSLMEQRITLVLLLLNYKFELSSKSTPNAPLEKSINFLLASSDVFVDFEEIKY